MANPPEPQAVAQALAHVPTVGRKFTEAMRQVERWPSTTATGIAKEMLAAMYVAVKDLFREHRTITSGCTCLSFGGIFSVRSRSKTYISGT